MESACCGRSCVGALGYGAPVVVTLVETVVLRRGMVTRPGSLRTGSWLLALWYTSLPRDPYGRAGLRRLAEDWWARRGVELVLVGFWSFVSTHE